MPDALQACEGRISASGVLESLVRDTELRLELGGSPIEEPRDAVSVTSHEVQIPRTILESPSISHPPRPLIRWPLTNEGTLLARPLN